MCSETGQRQILVLNGSPHRSASTTMTVVNAFVEGLLASGGCTAEVVCVSELNIRPCMGCLSCWARTEGRCVIEDDDIAALKEKILRADIVIQAFPLYFFGVPGQVKLMTDRLLSMMNTYQGQHAPRDGASAHGLRYPSPTRKFLLFSGCAYVETNEVYEPVRRQYDLICGRGNYTAIFCPQLRTMVRNGGTRLERTLERFRAAGEEFYKTGALSGQTLRALTRPPFSDGVYQTVLSHVWAEERAKGADEHDPACN